MSSWPLYVFYVLLLSLPLLFFAATKPGYEKLPQSSGQEKKTKAAYKHSAKPNAGRGPAPDGEFVSAPTPPEPGRRSS